MNDTMVTVVGNVVDSPRLVRVKNGSVTNFRMASTARRYDSGTQQYVDASTFWIDVECWSDLSTHVSASIGKGDPVVVHGMLSTHQWESDAGRRSRPQIKALAVGHNLGWGLSRFTKVKGARSAPQGFVEGPAESVDATPPTDLSDEEYAGRVDPLTGELLASSADEASEDELPEFLRGRDYVTDPSALHSATSDDLASQPAHV